MTDAASFPLFAPADRPALFQKALASGADAVILDLEDAVAPENRDAARAMLGETLAAARPAGSPPVWVRVNAAGSRWHDADVAALAGRDVAAVLVPKAEDADALESLRRTLGPGTGIVALIETARGVAEARALARASDRLGFGSIDLSADLGCDDAREPMLFARSEVVLAARLAGHPGAIDGVTIALRDEARIEDDARYAARLGFTGKMLIHPAQIGPARRGFAPSDADLLWARRILEASSGPAAVAVDGQMVDAPVVARANLILKLHEKAG